jgi:hypothetical protein
MRQMFVALRALVYATAFLGLWGWLVTAAARLDRAA